MNSAYDILVHKVNIFIFNFAIIIFLTIIITKPLGPAHGKMVKFNPGLSQTSSTVFSSKNKQLDWGYKILLSLY